MLACKKCHQSSLAEPRRATVFVRDRGVTLPVAHPSIRAHRKAMKFGPLCDPCLADWQEKHKAESEPTANSRYSVASNEATGRRLPGARQSPRLKLISSPVNAGLHWSTIRFCAHGGARDQGDGTACALKASYASRPHAVRRVG